LYLDNRMRFTNPGECNAPPGDRPLPWSYRAEKMRPKA
jgi:hypothetical protein